MKKFKFFKLTRLLLLFVNVTGYVTDNMLILLFANFYYVDKQYKVIEKFLKSQEALKNQWSLLFNYKIRVSNPQLKRIELFYFKILFSFLISTILVSNSRIHLQISFKSGFSPLPAFS